MMDEKMDENLGDVTIPTLLFATLTIPQHTRTQSRAIERRCSSS